MTDFYSFVPQPNGPYVFSPTLDGVSYTVSVTWNLSGQRWYVNLFAPDGTRVFTLPLIGSPNGFDIQKISWENGTVTVVTATPHGLVIGSTIDLAVRNCVPDAYNGADVQMLVVDDVTLTYLLQANPGSATTLGKVSHDIDIAGGYFNTSTLVFREASQQFEVN